MASHDESFPIAHPQTDITVLVAEALELIKTKVISVKDRGLLESIIVQSESSNKSGRIPPCVTVIHGGPHAGSTTAFVPNVTSLAIEGCM